MRWFVPTMCRCQDLLFGSMAMGGSAVENVSMQTRGAARCLYRYKHILLYVGIGKIL